jgi:hypothetical protein
MLLPFRMSFPSFPPAHNSAGYLHTSSEATPSAHRQPTSPKLATSPCRFCRPPCHPLPHRCRFLPLLPPITRNVKLLWTAKPLECGVREEDALDTRPKSGKNGNVDHPTQHCRDGGTPVGVNLIGLGCWRMGYPLDTRDYPRHLCQEAYEQQRPRPIGMREHAHDPACLSLNCPHRPRAPAAPSPGTRRASPAQCV